MTRSQAERVSLLAELAATPVATRRDVIAPHGPTDRVLAELVDAVAALMLTDLQAALRHSSTLIETADAIGESIAGIAARRVRAQALCYANDLGDALAVLDSAKDLAASAGGKRDIALSELTRLHALSRLGRLDEAADAGQRAWRDLVDLGDAAAAAKADVNLGVVHRMRDRPDVAMKHFDRALPLLADQPMVVAQIQSNRAEALLDLHDFAGAEDAFRSALAEFQRAGAKRAAAIVEGNLADLMGRQGRFAEALRHFEHARRNIDPEASPGDAARLRTETAEVQLALGMLDEARHNTLAARDILDAQGLAQESARASLILGRTLSLMGLHADAQRELARSIREYRAIKQPIQAGRVEAARAESFILSGESHEAARTLIELLNAIGDRPVDLARVCSLLARAELDSHVPVRALAYCDAGIAYAMQVHLTPLLAELHHTRGCALMALGRNHEALASLELSMDTVERIRGSLQADRFRTSFHARAAAIYDDAIAASLALHGEQAAEQVWTIVERSRSRGLLDLLGAEPPSLETRTDEDNVVHGLLRTIARHRATLNALYTSLHESAVGRHAWVDEIRDAERAVADAEARLHATGRARAIDAKPATIKQVQASLRQHEAMIEYYVHAGRIRAFVIRHGHPLIMRDITDVSSTGDAIERLRFQISRALARGESASARLADDCRRELASLRDLLLAPLDDLISQYPRWLIVPHGPLHAVPYHALACGDDYIHAAHEVVQWPSASVLAKIARSGSPTRPVTALVVGVADDRAPAMEHEARAIAEIVPGSRLLVGQHATVAAVLEHSAGVDLLHIAAHGAFTSAAPLTSGIRLADGWLTPRDICAMRLAGAIVILTGCDTGRAVATGADELLGLTRAFLAAGASGILVSAWPVHDTTATSLVANVVKMWYLQGMGGIDPATGTGGLAGALRAAQLSLSRKGVHPAYWCPLFVVGAA